MGCHFLLWGIFPTQGSNLLLILLHCRQILYHWATREAQASSLPLPPAWGRYEVCSWRGCLVNRTLWPMICSSDRGFGSFFSLCSDSFPFPPFFLISAELSLCVTADTLKMTRHHIRDRMCSGSFILCAWCLSESVCRETRRCATVSLGLRQPQPQQRERGHSPWLPLHQELPILLPKHVHSFSSSPQSPDFVFVVTLLGCISFATPWTVARQAPLSIGFPKQEYWSGLPFPPPGDLPDPGIKPVSPVLACGFFITEPPGKPQILFSFYQANNLLIHLLCPVIHPRTHFAFQLMMILVVLVGLQ